MVETTGKAPGTIRRADPSTTRSPLTPRTRNLESTTAIGLWSCGTLKRHEIERRYAIVGGVQSKIFCQGPKSMDYYLVGWAGAQAPSGRQGWGEPHHRSPPIKQLDEHVKICLAMARNMVCTLELETGSQQLGKSQLQNSPKLCSLRQQTLIQSYRRRKALGRRNT